MKSSLNLKEKGKFIPAAVTPFKFSDLIHGFKYSYNNDNSLKIFKNIIKDYLNISRVYTFNSFMRAIYANLYSLKKINGKKKKIILQRYSCPTFTHAILAAGLKIQYCDTNPNTLEIDKSSLQKTNFSDVLALICINHFGFPDKMDEIKELCNKKKIYLIEDLGYALGSEFNNKRLGCFGDSSVLNLQEGKAIPVGGGIFTTNNNQIKKFFNDEIRPVEGNIPHLIKMFFYKLISNGYFYYFFQILSNLLNINLRNRFSMEDTIRKTVSEFDFNYNINKSSKTISNFQAKLASLIISSINEHIEKRKKNALILENQLSMIKGVNLIEKVDNATRIHYIRYPILVNRKKRLKILKVLLKNGIEASPMYIEHGMRINSNKFPGAEKVLHEILTLPCHPKMSIKNLYLISKILKENIN